MEHLGLLVFLLAVALVVLGPLVLLSLAVVLSFR
jgi:hypothetical protein